MLALCDDLVGRGWAAWNVEYRRLGTAGGGGWPATFDDVGGGHRRAGRAGRAARPEPGGGHRPFGRRLPGPVGRRPCGRRRAGRAAVGQAPLADLVACAREGVCGDQVPTLLDGGPDERPDRYREASPAARLPLRCRTLVVHGGAGRHRAAGAQRRLRARPPATAAPRCCRRRATTWSTSTRAPRPGGRWSSGCSRDRAAAEAMDAADPLAWLRDRFVLATAGSTWTATRWAGFPAGTPAAMGAAVEDWGTRLVTGWHDWIDLPARAGDELAPRGRRRPGRGAGVRLGHGQPVQAGRRGPRRPAGGASSRPRRLPHRPLRAGRAGGPARPRAGRDRRRPAGAQVALVSLSHVDYRSGELADMARRSPPRPTRAARWCCGTCATRPARWRSTWRRCGRRPGRRLHLQVPERRARARPPSCTCAREHHRTSALADPGLVRAGRPVRDGPASTGRPPGIARFLAGTPPIVGIEAVRAGAADLAEAGMRAAARASRSRSPSWRSPCTTSGWRRFGFTLGTPREADRRGAHVSVRHPDAWRICRALIEHARRHPRLPRAGLDPAGPAPAYTRFVDVWDAVDRLCRVVTSGCTRTWPPSAAGSPEALRRPCRNSRTSSEMRSAGTGRLKKKPWPSGQPCSISQRRCASRLDALGQRLQAEAVGQPDHGRHQHRGAAGRRAGRTTNERSILSVVTAIWCSRPSDEWPVPKSSIASRRPRSCSSAMIGSSCR